MLVLGPILKILFLFIRAGTWQICVEVSLEEPLPSVPLCDWDDRFWSPLRAFTQWDSCTGTLNQ